MTSHQHDHAQAHSHDDHPGHGDHHALADVLDLDALVLAGPLDAVREEIARRSDGPVTTFLDLGAGTGTGTFGLLAHFPQARAVALDGSEEMLQRLRERSETAGVADRVSTIHADLDHGLPHLDPVDLVWASASLHHLADPDRTLTQVAARLRPGGLLAVLELTGFPRFLPDGTPAGAAEAAAQALMAADRAQDMPAMGSDWGSRMASAGLVVEVDRTVVVDLEPPLPPAAGDYAYACLSGIRGAVTDRLPAADLAQLDLLLDGGSADVRGRSDLHVRTERHLCLARRPS